MSKYRRLNTSSSNYPQWAGIEDPAIYKAGEDDNDEEGARCEDESDAKQRLLDD